MFDQNFETIDVQRLVMAQTKAEVFLRGFLSPDADRRSVLASQLIPNDTDWEQVFVPDAVPGFRNYYAGLFTSGVTPTAKPGQTRLRVTAAQAEQLVYRNPLSNRFPGGYKKVVHLFQPQTIWLAWKFTEPNKVTGMAYDGLVFLPDERFLWFPKPWRMSQVS